MLPYALAIVVGLSSSILFVSAFLFKDLHRQDDFLWSGVGLFYALTLWVGSNNIRGSLLLGQVAAVCLLTAYFWQVWNLRTAIAKPEQNIPSERFSVVEFTRNLFKRKSSGKNSQPAKTKPVDKKKLANKKTQSPDPKSPNTTTNQAKSAEPSASSSTKVISTKNIAPTQEQPEAESKSQSPNTEQVPTTNPQPAESAQNKTQETDAETPNTSVTEDSGAEKIATDGDQQEKIPTSPSEVGTTNSEIQEIQVEEVTIIEEESNWDDEVEDIDPRSVTVIDIEAGQAEENREESNEQNT